MNNIMAWGGLAAAGAIIASCWSYLRAIYTYVSSFLITTIYVHEFAGRCVSWYCLQELKRTKGGTKAYKARRLFYRPSQRYEWLAVEVPTTAISLYWKGWMPILVSRKDGPKQEVDDPENFFRSPIRLSFIRGTLNPEEFVRNCVDYANRHTQNTESNRYRVIHCHGTANKPMSIDSSGASTNDRPDDYHELVGVRFLGCDWESVGPRKSSGKSALDRVAMNLQAKMFVDRVRCWYDSRDWFMERGLPWRLGACLNGPPGTGKTAFIRAVAEDFNLPVYSLNLATFFDDELLQHWQQACTSAPAIVLIEDIDGVFHGREPVSEGIKLTFDALLNAIDGVERQDGILLCVTTNHIEHLDPALGGESSEGLVTRPGRIDYWVTFGTLDEPERRQIIEHVLQDWPHEFAQSVTDTEGFTGAQVERYCIEKAQKLFWEKV